MRSPRRLLLLGMLGCPAATGLPPTLPRVGPLAALLAVQLAATTRVSAFAPSTVVAYGFGGHGIRCGNFHCGRGSVVVRGGPMPARGFGGRDGGGGGAPRMVPPSSLSTSSFSAAVTMASMRRGVVAVAASSSSGEDSSSDDDADDEEACKGRFVEAARAEQDGAAAPPSRREVLRTASSLAVAAAAAAAASATPARVQALPFNLGGGGGSKPGQYVPAKRATAYQVDSTIPPTLIPLRAAREAAVLKNLGNGLGTAKTPVLDESINLNNFMKKGITGAIDAAGLGDQSKKRGTGLGAASFVFLGANDPTAAADGELAASILTDIVKPRSRADTAVGLAAVAGSAQTALDAYLSSGDEDGVLQSLSTGTAELSAPEAEALLPVLRLARSKRLPLLALGPEREDARTVRSQGLQSVDLDRRARYVADTEGFINLTQDPRFKLYTDRSMLKNFRPRSDGDKPADFFAERILSDEAVATAASRWAILRPDSMVVVLCDLERARFMGGANGRVPRVCKFLSPDSSVDEESVTTILLNPTAEKTLSLSRFLRLEIGTSPETIDYQTKVADYLWFSTMPKVNMLPRMMNY